MPTYKKGASGMSYEVGNKGSLGKDMLRNFTGMVPKAPEQTVNVARKGNKMPSLPKGGKWHPEY